MSTAVPGRTLPVVAAPMGHTKTKAPMELCIDFLSLEADKCGAKSILLVTDHYTRSAQAFARKNQIAMTVAKI